MARYRLIPVKRWWPNLACDWYQDAPLEELDYPFTGRLAAAPAYWCASDSLRNRR
jgi:hypothetical protein